MTFRCRITSIVAPNRFVKYQEIPVRESLWRRPFDKKRKLALEAWQAEMGLAIFSSANQNSYLWVAAGVVLQCKHNTFVTKMDFIYLDLQLEGLSNQYGKWSHKKLTPPHLNPILPSWQIEWSNLSIFLRQLSFSIFNNVVVKKFKLSCEFLNYIVVSSFILFLVIINKVSLILFNSKPNGGTIIILTVKRQSLEYLRRVNGFKKCNHENNNYFLNSTYQQNLRMTSLIIEATLGKLNWIKNAYF